MAHRNNKPVTTPPVNAIVLSTAALFAWPRAMTRKTTAASEMSLWTVRTTPLYGSQERLSQIPERKMMRKTNPAPMIAALVVSISLLLIL
jgi:hypothetical protein